MDQGKPTIGKGNNTFKQDYVLYLGGGFGGGGLLMSAGVGRYTYWVEHNPFATVIRRMISENVSFEVTSDSGGFNPVDLYVRFDQSNDTPDELFTSPIEIAAGRSVRVPHTVLPPYYFTTNTVKAVTDPTTINDQGSYVYNAYQTGGLSISNTSFAYIAQAVVPSSPLLKAVFVKDIFRVGSTSDHTLYRDIIVELWDSNRNFYANLGIIHKGYPVSGSVDVNGNTITVLADTHVTADDSNVYWTELVETRLFPKNPIKVAPYATYYIVLRHTSATASTLYGVGSNTNSSGTYNGQGRYIFGQAYAGNGTTITAVSPDVSICFLTQRTNQRTAVTFYWGNPAYYWYPPALNQGQFQLIKEDFDEVI